MKVVALWLSAVAAFALICQSDSRAAGIIRGIYCHPQEAVDNRLWASYGSGYEQDTQEKHSGSASIKCTNATDGEAHGAVQNVTFNQDKPRPIVVAGWAKLEGVSGQADYHQSVYLDLRLKNGETWAMKIAAFDPNKTGWQFAEQTYTPPAPIESARVYVFLRERKGVAWFDDIYVGEVMDAAGRRSPNLLKDPGFEQKETDENSPREKLFAKLNEIGCNAFHFYRSVPWETVMGNDPERVPQELPGVDPKDRLLDFVRDAHRHGLQVWLTVVLELPRMDNIHSPWFPFYPCVNNLWGVAYTRAIAYFAQFGFDGIGMVPDEWTYDNRAVRDLSKHSDPEVARFYANIPAQCDCAICRTQFKQQTGLDYPDVRHLWSTADPVWARYMQFRYDSSAAWIRRSVELAKRVNPNIITDTMICVLPICSDDRRRAGAAWDQIGAMSGLDCLQTDPYIFAHNYLGDSTHYYPTETAIHLSAANWKGRAGVTLEACRLYDRYRDKEPVEVYGAALSCLSHGATEFFWWHLNYLLGRYPFVAPEPPSRQVAAANQVIRAMESELGKTRVPGELLVLYSRTSEDVWHWLAGLPEAERRKEARLASVLGDAPNPRRGFIAHRNLIYWLLRRGYPFQMTFIEHPDPARLQAAQIVLVPFPFALPQPHASLLERLARSGKTVILMSELSPVDELGQPVPTPRLARLFTAFKDEPGKGGIASSTIGRGKVLFLGGDFAVELFEQVAPMKDPKGVVPLPPFDAEKTQALQRLLAEHAHRPLSIFSEQPKADVETTLLEGGTSRLLLLINWETSSPADVRLRRAALRSAKSVEGYAITPDAHVRMVKQKITGDPWAVHLTPQEAMLLRLL